MTGAGAWYESDVDNIPIAGFMRWEFQLLCISSKLTAYCPIGNVSRKVQSRSFRF